MQRGLGKHDGLVRLDTGLSVDVIGLGASASTYYPAVGGLLGCKMILPIHAGVANAIGAVVGRVTIRKQGTVTAPSEGVFRVHLDSDPVDFTQLSNAFKFLEQNLSEAVIHDAQAAGVENPKIEIDRDIRSAKTEARDVFYEATFIAEASGRPRIAKDTQPKS
jgi:hypothetical protein